MKYLLAVLEIHFIIKLLEVFAIQIETWVTVCRVLLEVNVNEMGIIKGGTIFV